MNEREIEKILKALANRRRLQILGFLKRKKTAIVSDIAYAVKLSFRSTSRHLAVLYSRDIVQREQRGLQVVYRINSALPELAKHIISIV